MQGENYTKRRIYANLGKGYLSLSPCTELSLAARRRREGWQRAALRIIAEKGRSDSGVGIGR